MICRLCLKDASSVFNIFADKGVQLQVAETVAKHFWFEPKPDDPISTVICDTCWSRIADFNEFYVLVEEAHRRLTERFSLKIKKEENPFINGNEIITAEIPCTEIWKETERTAVATQSCETLFNDVLDEKGADPLEEIERDINLQHIKADDISFGDENEFTECLSLGEQDTSEEGTLKVSTAASEETHESKRLTRSGSKRTAVKSKSKRCIRPRKKSASSNTVSGLDDSKVKNIICLQDELMAESSIKDKYHRIDERISEFLCLKCDICCSKEATFTELCKHMQNVHNIVRGYAICCDKKFYRRSLLFHHIENHLNPNYLRCEECDRIFSDRQCLRNHIFAKHQPEEAKIFSCKFCEKKFAKAYLLEQHQRRHEERNHICENCSKGFPTQSLLNAHIRLIHKNYGTMCEICAKVIPGRSAFARHVLEHQGVTFPKVQCTKCSAWYKNKHSLQKHMRRHNEEGTIHKCNKCEKVSPNRNALLAHIRYVHKEREFQCTVCKKAFKKQISLKEHMTMHTGETLYNCPHCPRTFNSNANMHSHRKKMHPKEFAEARLKRQQTKIIYPNDGVTENPQEQDKAIANNREHPIMLPSDFDLDSVL